MTSGIITVLTACALALLLSLSGCSPLTRAMENGLNLTPEQITALDQAGSSVIACLQVGGPPASGGGSVLIVPKQEGSGTIKFSVDCHPTGEITLRK